MEKRNTQTSPGALYFRHEMFLCFSYQFLWEHLPTLSAAHTTQADPRAASPGSPSISQGAAATAPSQRTLGLCFPFLQTALYGSAATQQVHLPGQPHWQQLTREAGPPHSRSVSSGLLETLLAAAARVLLFVWRILLLQPFKLTFDLRPPICFTERVYKQANGSYQLIIHNFWKEPAVQTNKHIKRGLVH